MCHADTKEKATDYERRGGSWEVFGPYASEGSISRDNGCHSELTGRNPMSKGVVHAAEAKKEC